MSDITPRERREVAKSLRYLADLPGGPLENDEQFVAVLKYWIFLDFKRCSYDETLTRLADLIDPTCHDFGGEEGTNGEGYDFACSACGWCGDVTKPNYCPSCGARVVRDDL